MYTHITKQRVPYALTDRMGVMYHGDYAQFFEIGRVEALRSLGINYKKLEDNGVVMPIAQMNIRFVRPAFYDDLLTIETSLPQFPKDSKFIFEQKVFNDKGELLTKATIDLLTIDKNSFQRIPVPQAILNALQPHYSNL